MNLIDTFPFFPIALTAKRPIAVVLALVASVAAAHAAPKLRPTVTTRTFVPSPMPPVQFDILYSGKLMIQRFSNRDNIPCGGKVACAWHNRPEETGPHWCYLAIGSGRLARAVLARATLISLVSRSVL